MPRFRGFTARSNSTTSAPPSKEEILGTMDQFGDKEKKEDGLKNSTSSNGSQNGTPSDVEDTAKSRSTPGDTENSNSDSISMVSAYCSEWERLFMVDDYYKKLKDMGMVGDLRSSRFRSVCWKLYLECLPENRREWVSQTRTWRRQYEDLKTKLIINPRKAMDKADLSINNPLSQEEESPWNQFFQDNELRVTIKQDVIRTFPEIEFFHSESVREQLLDILFCYARVNKKLDYKQGMHELLAPLIFVLHCDHQAFLHACEIESIELIEKQERPVVKEIMNPDFIEHDAFNMFCKIMDTVEPWYVSKEISPTIKNTNIFTAQPFARQQDMHPSNVIITKLTRIQDYVLKRFDPELHAHLEKMEIAPQIYGIRWVRLLFGREFPMQDLLVLWDAIFADGISFDLVDYIFVGMLQYIRELLLFSDYPTCLTTLMKFPPVGDVHYFVDKAVYLREPNEHPKPRDYVYQKFPLQGMSNNSQLLDRVTKSYSRSGGAMTASVMSSLTSLTRKLNQTRPSHLGLDTSPKKISKSTSEPMNLLTDESPEYRPVHEKRGSTASLSKLESGILGINNLRPASSAQSLAKLETTSVRESAGSVANLDQLSPEEGNSPPVGNKYASLPGRGKKGKKQKERSAEHDLAIMMGRLHDMEAMCKQCALKMGKHIDKLQTEMLRHDMHNEDELLLALAGLKQVRDVLKGILKPCNIFDDDEIKIRDNHYQEDASSADATPSSVAPRMNLISSPEMRRAAHAATFKAVNQVEDSSPDSSSPEYSENVRPQDAKGTLVNAVEMKPEIEMISLRTDASEMLRQLSIASDNGTIGAGTYDSEITGHRRSYSVGNHEFDIFDPNQNKASAPYKQGSMGGSY